MITTLDKSNWIDYVDASSSIVGMTLPKIIDGNVCIDGAYDHKLPFMFLDQIEHFLSTEEEEEIILIDYPLEKPPKTLQSDNVFQTSSNTLGFMINNRFKRDLQIIRETIQSNGLKKFFTYVQMNKNIQSSMFKLDQDLFRIIYDDGRYQGKLYIYKVLNKRLHIPRIEIGGQANQSI